MSIHQLGNGKWVVRYRVNDHNKARTVYSEADAIVLDTQIRAALRKGEPVSVPTISEKRQERALGSPSTSLPTLEQYFVQPFGDTPSFYERRQAHLADNTRKIEAGLWDKRIGPTLGQQPINLIDIPAIEDWRDGLIKDGVGPTSIERCRKIISKLLTDATKRGLIRFNPVSALSEEKHSKKPVVPLEPVETERIVQHLGQIDGYMVRILAGTGLRPGELLGTGESPGVCWKDLRPNGKGHLLTVTAGKTKAIREVRILDPILADLEKLREITGGKDDDGIVPSATGGLWSASMYRNWRSRKWRVARTNAKLRDQRPYDLRHGYASLLLHTGKPLHYVARQMGNDPRILSKTYAHILDGLADHSIDMTAEDVILDARETVLSQLKRGRGVGILNAPSGRCRQMTDSG